MEIPMLKIRRDRLIFNMGIPILARQNLYIETTPRLFTTVWLKTSMYNNGIFRDYQVKLMATDVLATWVGRTSTIMMLTMQDKLILVFSEEWFQLPVPFCATKDRKYIFYVSSNNSAHKRVNSNGQGHTSKIIFIALDFLWIPRIYQ